MLHRLVLQLAAKRELHYILIKISYNYIIH